MGAGVTVIHKTVGHELIFVIQRTAKGQDDPVIKENIRFYRESCCGFVQGFLFIYLFIEGVGRDLSEDELLCSV